MKHVVLLLNMAWTNETNGDYSINYRCYPLETGLQIDKMIVGDYTFPQV